jgi:hypothetical protein
MELLFIPSNSLMEGKFNPGRTKPTYTLDVKDIYSYSANGTSIFQELNPMKKIGIIGGIGPESTLDYYRGIIDAVREKSGGVIHYPDIIIFSAGLTDLLRILGR